MRIQAAGLLLCVGLLLAPFALRAVPRDGAKEKPKSEKWIVVTGNSSGRLVWTAFSLGEMGSDPKSEAPAMDLLLINTLLNNLGIACFDSQMQFDADSSKELGYPGGLMYTLLSNLGIPLVTDDVLSCDLHTQEISPAMLGKGQTIELLHYLMKHFHNAAGNSNFELQVNCPLPWISEPKEIASYIDKPIAFSLKNKTKTGLSRMVRLSNLVGKNVTQVLQAIDGHDIVVPGPLKESATPKEIAGYWTRFVLSPFGVECNSVVYDDDLSCLIIDVKRTKGEKLSEMAESYWAGEILRAQM